jgi:putative transposase
VILFEDEASLSNTATVSYSWAEKGKQPRISQPQRKRERKTIFGAVNPQDGKLVVDTADRGNTKTFFRFLLKCARACPGQKVYIVLDNVRFHHAKRLTHIAARHVTHFLKSAISNFSNSDLCTTNFRLE